jgi:fermentation-respiration switch protein FrsA (DUF1100 family)
MNDVRQPILIVQGDLDKQVLPYHADKLAELARARKNAGRTEVVHIPDVNHLLVSAKTGEMDEYGRLENRNVSTRVLSAITDWLQRTLTRPAPRTTR